jgi:predicted 3-demethylubiquinone-9 3-methyltransferase (glyoxalase superfamily)
MNNKIITFLMFYGNAEEAMNYYISLFKNSKIKSLVHYKENEAGVVGTVMHAVFILNGQEYMCTDSAVKHNFTFTPAISLYVNCESKEELAYLYTNLSEGGQIFMPLETHDSRDMFCWIEDKFGVSWLLNLDNK